MELFTLDRKFLRQNTIDVFHSAIWTERYYGDSEVQLVVPLTLDRVQTLKPGTFLGLVGSDEIMMLETANFEDGKMTVTGISLMKWLNNRFLRATAAHKDRYWTIADVPGMVMADIVFYSCIGGGFLDGSSPTGIPSPQILRIPGLSLGDHDAIGQVTTIGVPYGPVFDATYELATTYELGQQIILASATDAGYSLLYRNYRGLDRTSSQSTRPIIRFSQDMDSLTGIKELQSIATYKTLVFSFAPGMDEASQALATTPGQDGRVSIDQSFSGFDLRADMIFCEDITTDQVAGSAATLLSILNSRAKDALSNAEFVKVVDGEVVPGIQWQYGMDYNLGDIVEIQGNSGTITRARVTEYIHSQDETGEKDYPTLSVKD